MSAGEEEQDGQAAAPVYVYESKIHCANVLLNLEEQRRQGILCDVTVLVEGREVRAHRAVLAASSRYFLQALLGTSGSAGDTETIINLPDKVTAKGFAPLLQFAYTAKLVLSRENIHEVVLCADFLGVHNLEDSCFQFLQAQLLNDSEHARSGHIDYNEDIPAEDRRCSEDTKLRDSSEARTNHVAGSPPSDLPQCKHKYQISGDHGEVLTANHQTGEQGVATQTLLSPSRIKQEQFVFEEERRISCDPELCSEEVLEMELEVEGVPVAADPCPSRDLSRGPSSTIQQLLTNQLSLGHYLEHVKDRSRDKTGTMTKPSSSKQGGVLDRHSVIFSSTAGEQQRVSPSYEDDEFRDKVPPLLQVEAPPSGGSCLSSSSPTRSPAPSEPQTQRSSFRSSFSYQEDTDNGGSPPRFCQFDVSLSPHSGSASGLSHCLGKGLEQRNSGSEELRFSQDITQIKSERGFVASGGNSSDESESFSEEDSESGLSRVSCPEVMLPFPVDQITNLPRNDFQILVKMHQLSSEQLDFIHDIRRRSKNRIAAQRCRKRKLDRIQSLQREIRKLVSEKEKLVGERQQLRMSMSELWHKLSILSQQVCSQVQPPPPQPTQTDAPTSIDLTSTSVSPSPDRASSPPMSPPTSTPAATSLPTSRFLSAVPLIATPTSRSSPTNLSETRPQLRSPDRRSTEEVCSPTVIVDFCQEMTVKCSTEEQDAV